MLILCRRNCRQDITQKTGPTAASVPIDAAQLIFAANFGTKRSQTGRPGIRFDLRQRITCHKDLGVTNGGGKREQSRLVLLALLARGSRHKNKPAAVARSQGLERFFGPWIAERDRVDFDPILSHRVQVALHVARKCSVGE